MDLDSFIDKANNYHNFKYSYGFVKFNTLNDLILIECPIHGCFEQKASTHLKSGCKKCRDDSYKLGIDVFLEKANKKHNYKYKYIIDNYINNKQKIDIICGTHGLFNMRIDVHLRGSICPKCKKEFRSRKSYKNFVEKANVIHNSFYDYSESYVSNFSVNSKIKIICPIHGNFNQLVWQHLGGNKCKECSCKNRRLTKQEFIDRAYKIHGDKYDYSLVDLNLVSSKVKIKCYKHGVFRQLPSAHIYSKQGCPNCSKIISKAEIEWLDFLKIPNEFRNVKLQINGRTFFPDAFDPNTKIVYEFYGDYWHGNPNIYNPNDLNKLNKTSFAELYKQTIEREAFLKKNRYTIVSIWENEWTKIKSEMIDSEI